uniref:Integrase, catalytic region, zinc finger, CCHC-type, peptidase aspartic, catalytic n=1 Tax=Tanacetum cinerariifolium TaxID=118510 RepID=A0A6L2LLC6_TANCI|nr:hypothetical protein [Tanacetum cinerariifolium]
MTTLTTTTNNSKMHNDIMATSFKDHPPMLAIGRYAQWQSRFMRYVDTKPNSKELKLRKEEVKPVTPPSVLASDKDSDKEHAQRDKKIQKSLALNAKHFKNIYKPTNNNLRTASNTKNKNRNTSLRNKNDNQTGQFVNQRMECRKPKRVKDYAYHKEKMMLCNQEEKSMPLRSTFDAEPLENVQSDDDYNVFANERQHYEQPESINDTNVVETVDSNVISDSLDMCDNEGKDDQNAEEYEDERVVLDNLIANLKLATMKTKRFKSN